MPTVASPNSPSQRDLRFDSLRGLMLVMMAINHIDSGLRVVTDQPLGYVSSAEGFVFLSGLVAGWIYLRKVQKLGAPLAYRAAWRRAGQIYVWHLLAYFAVFGWTIGVTLTTDDTFGQLPELFTTHPWQAVIVAPLLLYQPGLLDILPMYCVFLVLLPFVLMGIQRGWRWPIWWLSAATWLLAQIFGYREPTLTGFFNPGAFNLFAWQFIFISGAIIGTAKCRDESLLPVRRWLVVPAIGLAVLLTLEHHGGITFGLSSEVMSDLANKTTLAPLRLANFALLAYLIAVSAKRWPTVFTWNPLAFLGQHSLVVFSLQSIAAAIFITFPNTFSTPLGGWVATVLMIAVLFVAAWLDQRFGWRKTETTSGRPHDPLFPSRKPQVAAR